MAFEFRDGQWPAEKVSLVAMATGNRQKFLLFGGLNAFCDGLKAQALGQRNDRRRDRRIVRINENVSHERLVDLLLFEGEQFQIGQG